jgi:mRNA interferase YafQ
MREIVLTTKFKKSFKKVKSLQNFKEDTFDYVILMLSTDLPLPIKFRDHKLKGEFIGYSECHIAPDILLIYQKYDWVT